MSEEEKVVTEEVTEKTNEEVEENTPSISAATITRTILLALSTINLILNSTGNSTIPFVEDDISTAVSIIFQIVTSIAAWWKDNDITKKARVNKQKINELLKN